MCFIVVLERERERERIVVTGFGMNKNLLDGHNLQKCVSLFFQNLKVVVLSYSYDTPGSAVPKRINSFKN